MPIRESVADRIVSTLEACASKKRSATFTELVEETGLAKTTVHRMCWKMVELGLLEHSPEGFAVGSKLFALAASNPSITDLRVAAIPHLIELHQRTGAMPSLAILSGGQALVLDGLFTRESSPLPRLVGYALPLHCTAIGKAIAARLDPEDAEELLFSRSRLPAATKHTIVRTSMLRDHLARVAETGVALSDEELIEGNKGVAAGFKLGGGGVAAIGCVEAWNSPTLRDAPVLVARAAASLEQAMA